MSMQQLNRVSLADEVYSRLKQDLTDFVWVPGDRFTENEISERLQVSRTPVRQALLRLQQEGHVEVLFRNGWRVLPFDFERFDQLYDLRVLIETEAVQRLCEGRVRGDPARSLEILEDLSNRWLVPKIKRSIDPHQVCLWDEHFHLSLVEATGNTEMLRTHQEITDRIRVIRRLDFTQRPRIDATYDEHSKILKSIQSQRTDQSRMWLKMHIESSQLEVRKITLHHLHQARKT
jgi:DNA-binding GntR family transcriptional regulator